MATKIPLLTELKMRRSRWHDFQIELSGFAAANDKENNFTSSEVRAKSPIPVMPETIAFPLILALTVSLVFSFLFLSRIIVAAFSSQIRQETHKKPLTHFLMFCAIPISIGLVLALHPWPLRVYEVRKLAHERIKDAGGLGAIKSDCLIIANESSNQEEFIWTGYKTNSFQLPPAIAALKPVIVLADAPEISGTFVPFVRIHILGRHSTDNSWPEYWLWFAKGDISADSLKQVGNHSRNEAIRVLTNSVYEVIQ